MNESRSGDPPAEPMNGRSKHTDRPASRLYCSTTGQNFFSSWVHPVLLFTFFFFFFRFSCNHGITFSILWTFIFTQTMVMRRWNVKTTYWFLFPLIIDIKIRPEWCIFLKTKNKKTILNLETHIATVQFGIGVCVFFYYFFAHKLKKFTWKCSNAFLFTLHLLKVTFSLGVHWVWVCLQYLFTRYDMCGSYEFGRGKDTLLSNSFVIFFYPLRAMCFFFSFFFFLFY